jgi:hypothetical protein
MATSQTEISVKKRRDRDKRYRKSFYVGIEFYDALLAEQDYKCGACGRPASDFTVSLNIDHEHFTIKHEQVTTPDLIAINLRWRAYTFLKDGRTWESYAKTQKQARADLKAKVMPHSIRGLLCPGRYTGCNRLMGRIDKPNWLRKVLEYLENTPASRVQEKLLTSL